MSRQVLDGKLITVNQPQFAFGLSHEGTRPGLNISIAPPLATPASGRLCCKSLRGETVE